MQHGPEAGGDRSPEPCPIPLCPEADAGAQVFRLLLSVPEGSGDGTQDRETRRFLPAPGSPGGRLSSPGARYLPTWGTDSGQTSPEPPAWFLLAVRTAPSEHSHVSTHLPASEHLRASRRTPASPLPSHRLQTRQCRRALCGGSRVGPLATVPLPVPGSSHSSGAPRTRSQSMSLLCVKPRDEIPRPRRPADRLRRVRRALGPCPRSPRGSSNSPAFARMLRPHGHFRPSPCVCKCPMSSEMPVPIPQSLREPPASFSWVLLECSIPLSALGPLLSPSPVPFPSLMELGHVCHLWGLWGRRRVWIPSGCSARAGPGPPRWAVRAWPVHGHQGGMEVSTPLENLVDSGEGSGELLKRLIENSEKCLQFRLAGAAVGD